MLVLSRRADQSIVIQPADGADANMTMAQLFANGPIQITLLGGTGRRIKMGIDAPEQLIWGARQSGLGSVKRLAAYLRQAEPGKRPHSRGDQL